MKKDTKIAKIVKYMRTHRGITQMKAYELCNATRLAAIIAWMKNKGYQIETVYIHTDGCRRGYAEYRFTPEFKKELSKKC